ncbi:division/cell wall cluster transcriptional repressor MraZ [Aquisalimonas sp.]|uniref:division/cell wall cluster transcriptional repressor MraZ n=1 Tax=Aquisalimonas sp. TaxID=1872621 RepID=UPI0025BDA7E6|nr:division/cell wall cluster transcriptional repressor MraZ [Aquisalimonas sp.]
MFRVRGVANLNLDTKGRMSFPSRFRDRLMSFCDGEVVVTADPERCLLVYPLPEWEEIEDKLMALPSLNAHARSLQRVYLGHATEAQLDGSGRILLPPPLREFAGLDKRVVLVGQGKRFELWDENAWNEQFDHWLSAAADKEGMPEELQQLSL